MKIWWMALMLGVTGCKAKVEKLPAELQAVADVVPRNIVIAHRGTTFWAPEEPQLFPGMEADLARELTWLGWYDPKGRPLRSAEQVLDEL